MAKPGSAIGEHVDVTFRFGNRRAAELFMDWMSGLGEQHYWTDMDIREEEEEGPIIAQSFYYNYECNLVTTECSRNDNQD